MNPRRWGLLPLLMCLFAGSVLAQHGVEMTFTNPIVVSGQDPWVLEHGGLYYYCFSTGRGIGVRVSDRLHLIGGGVETVLWRAPETGPYSKNVWAPELHRIGGRWYIYFAADDGENRNHRMFVLRSEGDDPLGPYTFAGKIADEADRWAIDGTVYQSDEGDLYFIWSGWPGVEDVQQNLYVAAMSDPVTVVGGGVVISEPTLGWETTSEPRVNEGPEILQRGGKVHVIYSAGGSWTDDYCLGRLTLVGDDPLAVGAWAKHPEAVFAKTGEVFGPGHASFVHVAGANEDGNGRDWIIYHAARSRGSGWDRDIRLQAFKWDVEGNPDFGRPTPPGEGVGVPRRRGGGEE